MDTGYWDRCQRAAQDLPGNIRFVYGGALAPHEVNSKLAETDAYIQLSKSENFGHSIVEAMQAGLPVVTSHGTPWNGLADAGCGVNVDPGEDQVIADWLDDYSLRREADFEEIASNSRRYISARLNRDETISRYRDMLTARADQ